MLLTIHDANLKKVAFVENDKAGTLNFFNDEWRRNLETASSVFTFSVFKKALQYDTMTSKTYNVLNERSFVSFRYKGRTYLFNVMTVKENEDFIECSCYYLSLELTNEYMGAYKAEKAMSFIDYMNLWGMVENNAITIGINEVKDQQRKLEWEGEDTALNRLLSIANKFDAEVELVTKLKPDSSLDSFVLNIYKANNGKDIQGVGKRRSDILLQYGRNVKDITRTIDKTEIFNAVMPIGTSSQSTDDAKKTTAAKQASGGKATYTGSEIKYGGKTLSKDNLSKIVDYCRKNDLLISGVICQLWLESNWGTSNVARMDNNWGGFSGGAQIRPSGVVVTTGSSRPANEGGTYMHYANLDDFFKDYSYTLANQGTYAVKGKKNIDDYTKGLFRAGGAKYDYAAAGYGHYISLMRSIRDGVNQANNSVLDKLDRGELVGNISSSPESHSATSDPRVDKMIQWFEARQGKVSYSMQARTGPNSYDCSSAVYYAMKHAGFGNIGTWPFSTETMHDPLKREGYQLVSENRSIPLQRGDIIIWGKRGFSAGADGHVMVMKNANDMIHCNFRHNGISTNNYQAYIKSLGRTPYFYVYRLPNQKGAGEVAPKVQAALRKLDSMKNQRIGTGQCYAVAAWYSRELGGPGLGGGVTGISDVIGDTMRAGLIGEGYNWAKYGWKVVQGGGDIRAGGLYNVQPNIGGGIGYYGHTGVIKEVKDGKVTTLEQNNVGMYVSQHTYNLTHFRGTVRTVCYPPELAGGANINEAPKPAEPKKEEAKAAATTGTEVVEVKVDPKRYQEWKNDKGQVEFYLKNGMLYAPLSRDLYPSVLSGKETSDNWIRKDMKIETDSQDVLISSALRELRKHAYPKITYEVDGYVDLEIGDTVKIRDEGFTPTLILQARVSEQTISFTNPANNKTVFSNFVALENKVSKNLMAELEKMVEDARPYEIRLTTDNGVAFKNSNGSSLLTAELFKGRSERQAVFIFKDLEDNFLGTSQQLEVKAEDIENVLNVVVEAYVDNVLVATTDISFTNTKDGTVGQPGEPGEDGRTPYFHTAYADSEDGRIGFTVEDYTNKEFMGTYTDYIPEDSTDPGMYKWVKVRGDDGQDGRGVDSYKNYYFLSAESTGISLPTNPENPAKDTGWTSDVQVPTPQKRFLWYYRVEEYSDDTTKITEPFVLSVHGIDGRNGKDGRDGVDGAPGKDGRDGKDGAQGPRGLQGIQGEQGIPGEKGKDGRTQYTHIAYADTNLGGGFSQTTNGSKVYMGMYVDFEEADSPNPARYRWTKVKGEKGDQGIPGQTGKDGRTPYFHVAYANSEDGTKDFSTTIATGRRYMGTVTDFNQADPTNPTAYRWTMIAGADERSGNLLLDSNKQWESSNFHAKNYSLYEPLEAGHTYTLAIRWWRGESNNNYKPMVFYNGWRLQLIAPENTTNNQGSSTQLKYDPSLDCWWATFTVKKESEMNNGQREDFANTENPRLEIYRHGASDNKDVTNDDSSFKTAATWATLVRGSVPLSRWEPHWSETKEAIDAKADAELTTEQINRLNEQAGIMSAELEAKASADTMAQWMETVKNQFENVKQGQQEAEQALISDSQRIIALQQNIGDMKIRTDFMDTYFSQSNDGLILGRKDGSSAVRVTNDRISFVSAGKEVAFISQGVLQIDNGVFVKSLQVGRFRLEQHQSNLDMNVIRYIGGL